MLQFTRKNGSCALNGKKFLTPCLPLLLCTREGEGVNSHSGWEGEFVSPVIFEDLRKIYPPTPKKFLDPPLSQTMWPHNYPLTSKVNSYWHPLVIIFNTFINYMHCIVFPCMDGQTGGSTDESMDGWCGDI